jgi:hypothetical protein
MNERIDVLALQATDSKGGLDRHKFAKLIVRDCATKANATALDLRIHPELDARKYVGDGILKLFGVEE